MADALGAKGVDGIQKVQLFIGTKALESVCSKTFHDHGENKGTKEE